MIGFYAINMSKFNIETAGERVLFHNKFITNVLNVLYL